MAQALASHRAAPAVRRPSTSKSSSRTSKPKLKVLNQQAIRQRARRRNALLVLFIVVLVGFFAVALVQAQLVADQQGLDLMRARIAEAEAENARMTREVEAASAPTAIVGRATELGMVRAHQPVYLAAVAPVRDVPVAPAFEPQRSGAFDLAAPQAASDSSIAAGINGQGPLSVDEPVAEVAALTQSPPIDEPPVQVPVQVPVTTTAPSVTTASVAGLSAATGSSATADASAVSAAAVTVDGTEAVAGSIAGSTAVVGGSGSG